MTRKVVEPMPVAKAKPKPNPIVRAKPKPVVQPTFADNRAQLDAMAAVADRSKAFRPAVEVLTKVRAVPTIFPQVDGITKVGGWPTERFCLVHGASNEGKAQSVDTPVLTPTGWRRMGDLCVGDLVIAGDGSPTSVTGVFPQGCLQLYRVSFSDGTSTECCDDHLWHTRTKAERDRGRFVHTLRPDHRAVDTGRLGVGSVKSLREIRSGFKPNDHEIPACGPVEFEPVGGLLIDPYLLGLMLGDGGFTGCTPMFHKPEPDLRSKVAALLPDSDVVRPQSDVTCSIVGGELTRRLRLLGLMGLHSWEKFIPEVYMRASIADRRELLIGLLDTDGSVVKAGGAVEYSSSSYRLASQVVYLARSLGWVVVCDAPRVTKYTHNGELRDGKPSTRCRIYAPRGVVPVSSTKHLAAWKGRGSRECRKDIVSIRPSRKGDAVCIMVDHPSRLYVVEDFIVTHNTVFVHGLGLSFLQKNHFYLYVDAERTTPETWLQKLMAGYATHPGFRALRPDTYEATVDAVREFCELIGEASDKGTLPADTSGLIVIDSLRKLVPKRLLSKIMNEGADGDDDKDKRKKASGVDGLGGRAAQYKAALNAAWLDELIPLLGKSGTTMVAIARETEDPDAGLWGEGFKVGGGKALYYDSSLVVRISRSKWVHEVANDAKSRIIGERHLVEVRKTKIGSKAMKRPQACFHTSNGLVTPEGFDRARDVLEAAFDLELADMAGGGHVAWGKRKLGQGLNAAVVKLYDEPELMVELEAEVRAKYDAEAF